MAQDHPPASGQGYPHDNNGQQQPVGYDQQQPWYPQQPAEPGTPWTPDTGYQQQPYGVPEPPSWQPGDQWETGLPQQGGAETYQAGYTGVPYGYPTAAQPEQQLYAPAGTGEGYGYGGYLPYQGDQLDRPDGPDQADQLDQLGQLGQVDQHDQLGQVDHGAQRPGAGPAGYAVTAEQQPGRTGPTGFGEQEEFERAAGTGEATDPDASGPRSAAKPSLLDRAKAVAGNALAGDQAPSRRALAIRVGAGVAALAVLVTAGVLVTEDDTPSAPAADAPVSQNISVAHDRAWAAQPESAPPAGSDDTLVGGWLLADTVVRADGSGVRAYALADGKPAWTLAAPADGAVPCGLSPTVNAKGLAAVLFRPSADPKTPCSTLAVVDTRTGKSTWTKAVSDVKDGYAAHVAVTDDKVIAIGEDRVAAWGAEDGKDLWQYAGQGKFCTLSGGATGATVVLHSSCADSAPVDQAVALNAADGKVTWWRGLNNQPKTVTVLSAEPAVVVTTGEKAADDRVFAWGPSGDPAAEIPVAADGGRLDVTRGTFDAVPGVYFHEHTMIATTTPADAGAPAVTGYDLTNGKLLWRTVIAEKSKARPVGLDAGGLLLAVDERLDQPAHISRFALAGGQETQGGAFPQGTGSLLTSGRLLSGGGKVVAVPEHSSNFGLATAFRSKG
ncbi:PQQ-binding-like beta-propeller repeat protein [Kitasatospora sp. NPDC049258]|uniref:outer membrane protein assembly factor BamB family protein n=1 Tax=Kitasatospora sp. NPDC049258 TaxID=3155394 RepID=UPI00343B21BC